MESRETGLCGRLKLKKYVRSYAMILALASIWIIFQAVTQGTFLSIRNISNLFRQMSVVGVLAIGMTVCLIAGNFDLSVGSVTGFLGAMAAWSISGLSQNPMAAVLLAVVIGCLIGCWNGFWIAYAGVPAFIATLGSSLIFKGGLYIVTQGTTIPVRDPFFLTLGQKYLPPALGYLLAGGTLIAFVFFDVRHQSSLSRVLGEQVSCFKRFGRYAGYLLVGAAFVVVMNSYEGIPIAVFVLLGLSGALTFVLAKTRFGRKVYAVGGNPRAARMSGINNAAVCMTTFIIMGGLAGMAGVLQTARLAAATPGAAMGMELDAVASSVIGGVSLAGGSGKVINSVIGALVMASLTNGMSLLNVNSDVQYIVKGLILIVAVWFDVRMRRAQNG